jgi:hypothetical protein
MSRLITIKSEAELHLRRADALLITKGRGWKDSVDYHMRAYREFSKRLVDEGEILPEDMWEVLYETGKSIW